MSALKWIFFDLGWTLVDETEAHRARLDVVRGHLTRFGMSHTVDDLLMLCEQTASDFAPSPFRSMLTRLGLSTDQLTTIRRSARYSKEREALYPGVPELLAALADQFNLGIIANQTIGTEARLIRWGIRDYFSVVFASAEMGLAKPDARIFESALSATRCKTGEALMVGDRLDNDIGPARSQGWPAIRVLQGFSRLQQPRRREEVPDLVVGNVVDLSAERCLQVVAGGRNQETC